MLVRKIFERRALYKIWSGINSGGFVLNTLRGAVASAVAGYHFTELTPHADSEDEPN